MKRALLALLIVPLISPLAYAEDRAIANLFSAQGVDGTIVLSSLRSGQTFLHNDARAYRGFAPASSFKVVNTLIAVHENVARTKGRLFKWDGKQHEVPDWNHDQTLESAFKISCVWCYQEIARKVGKEAYRRYVSLAGYGSLAETFDVATFWLDGSLKVSAVEQVAFLRKVYLRELPFRPDAYDILKDVMLVEQADGYTLYAKTGWAARTNPQIGWYVGYIETSDDVWLFATNINLRSNADSALRQKLVKAALQEKHIIPKGKAP